MDMTSVFLPRSSDFVVGLDLGQSSDPSALAVIERVRGVLDSGSEFERHTGLSGRRQKPVEYFDVRHLQRLPLGLSYPNIVRCVRDLIECDPLENAELIIDETGVGRAVGDIFVAEGMAPKRISITAGAEATRGQGSDRFHVAKTILISTVDALLHTGTLRFAAALSEAGTMKDELLDFRRKLSDAGRATYAARTGKHDDLVLAVAIACWWLTRPPPVTAQTGRFELLRPVCTRDDTSTSIKQEPVRTSGFKSTTRWR